MRERMLMPTRWLMAVLTAHAVVLVAVTIVSARADTLKAQVLVLNVAVASQIAASVACATWIFVARRAVVARMRTYVARRAAHV